VLTDSVTVATLVDSTGIALLLVVSVERSTVVTDCVVTALSIDVDRDAAPIVSVVASVITACSTVALSSVDICVPVSEDVRAGSSTDVES